MADTFNTAAADAAAAPYSIHRASLRMSRAAWQVPLPSGVKLVLLSILSHYNDARGIAYPSIARLAKVCGLHRRTVQAHIALLTQLGVLWITRVPGLRTSGYRVDEVAISALKGGNFSATPAENTTQNGLNAFKERRDAAPEPAAVVVEAVVEAVEAVEMVEAEIALPAATAAPFAWRQHLHSAADHTALQNWQRVRRAKGRPPQPSAAQAEQLLRHARSVGQTLGWVLQVMQLNDWASFEPAWLNNQRPPPQLPEVKADSEVSTPAAAMAAPAPPPKPATPPPAPIRAHIHALLTRWRAEDLGKRAAKAPA